MKILIVEDDFVSRRLLQNMLEKYGKVDSAVNGVEALEAFKLAIDGQAAYDLICIDILMPEMNGQELLKAIKHHEEALGIYGGDGVKVIMTTSIGDLGNIKSAFTEQCDAYMVKPIDRERLAEKLKELKLVV
ncbi:MAG: response regulator [Syntrophomonadaceae bacterium]|nr:response regulator [Syntrophomonadaceae bacterium]